MTGEEITCLTLDWKKLAGAVAVMLNANPEPCIQSPGVILVGSHPVAAGIGIPIVLENLMTR